MLNDQTLRASEYLSPLKKAQKEENKSKFCENNVSKMKSISRKDKSNVSTMTIENH